MIELYVSGQALRLYTPVIAADTLHYLSVQAYFLGSEWDGCTRWLHCKKGDELGADVYDLRLDENDRITEDKGLNLTAGEWILYLTGSRENTRITTAPVVVTVKESGLVDAPLHALPMTVAEQLSNDAAAALAAARELRAIAAEGGFNGRDGVSYVIGGFFDSAEALASAVPEPEAGAAYGVGTAAPYDIYIWDAVNGVWKNNGKIQGAKGDAGDAGATFRPWVDADGNISWTNDGGLPNPVTQNIRGPAGQDGAAGPAGASAYDSAVEAGYHGTESTFNAALAAMPYHNARHLPDGSDPITVKTGNLEDGAVTAAKLAQGAVSFTIITELSAGGWQGYAAPFSQTIVLSALRATDMPIMDLMLSGSLSIDRKRLEDYNAVYRAIANNGSLTVYALSKPTVGLPIRLMCVRK